ncbi:hypothetical protein T492DRAFT_595023 [Pavlovales sp. CCMP2436]|nr:hypothetical protein T492DRAFT_595023 [Pavlovales sp. CCMP2436]
MFGALGGLWPTRYVAAGAYGIQWAVWALHAAPNQSERFYDLTGSLTYMTCTLASLLLNGENNLVWLGQRQQLVSLCLLIWSGRLGLFLFGRIKRDGGVDRRFNRIRSRPLLFLVAWTIQGTWVYLVGLPAYLLNTRDAAPSPLTWVDYVGLAVWASGLLLQGVADGQKSAFRAEPRNRDAFITSGLWALSRHPNYLGEITLHCGLALVAANGLPAGERVLAVAAPLFTSMLLLLVSGLPPLEKHAQQKWGQDPAFQKYTAETAVLLPYVSSVFRARAQERKSV